MSTDSGNPEAAERSWFGWLCNRSIVWDVAFDYGMIAGRLKVEIVNSVYLH